MVVGSVAYKLVVVGSVAHTLEAAGWVANTLEGVGYSRQYDLTLKVQRPKEVMVVATSL